MKEEDIKIRKAVIHILDTEVEGPVLSESELEFGSRFTEFLQSHIARVSKDESAKPCTFHKRESEVYRMLAEYDDSQFISVSTAMAQLLFEIMTGSMDIPSADLAVVRFTHSEKEYMALLKMNYKSMYTHRTERGEDGEEIRNEIARYRTILPGDTQKLTEAALICLNDLTVRAVEKKYDVNGEKVNYFTYLFLKCDSRMSEKAKLAAVELAIEQIVEKESSEFVQYREKMQARDILRREVDEKAEFAVKEVGAKIFGDRYDLRAQFQDKMEKYDIVEDVITLKDSADRLYLYQELETDTGIKIKIPMEQYRDPEAVRFIDNMDGSVSVEINGIGYLKARL